MVVLCWLDRVISNTKVVARLNGVDKDGEFIAGQMRGERSRAPWRPKINLTNLRKEANSRVMLCIISPWQTEK